jgi:hypothetical protein
VEEADVEVGAGRAGGERERGVLGLGQAVVEAAGKVRAGAVPFASGFGVGGMPAEGRGVGHAQDVPLPAGEQFEGQGRAGRGVGAGPVEGGEEAVGAFRGAGVVVGADVVDGTVPQRDDPGSLSLSLSLSLSRGEGCGARLVPGHGVAHGEPGPQMVRCGHSSTYDWTRADVYR